MSPVSKWITRKISQRPQPILSTLHEPTRFASITDSNWNEVVSRGQDATATVGVITVLGCYANYWAAYKDI